jgi:2-isopropylmalate synthase
MKKITVLAAPTVPERKNPAGKYMPFVGVALPDRIWPRNAIYRVPIWCSVDLRDGNQALPVPMNVEQKLELFQTLVKIGFKEIEVGFPAASDTEYAFVRRLIEEEHIPDDVTIQVLVQAREDLIKTTVESLKGARRVIIHLYNSTSPAQRRIVFGKEKPEIVAIAIAGTKWVKEYSAKLTQAGTEVVFQYSPESFSATEIDFSLQICTAVMETWQPTLEKKMILNLPDTVEVATPNVYADQIEYFCRNICREDLSVRDRIVVSLHTHNDRGTGVAATELGLMAGADRVEGTLFGNGERTGNLDIVTVALNLFTQGIDPKLDFSNLDEIRAVYERTTGMTVPARQPYAGELVFTAFSGSHQDAIRKGLKAREGKMLWDVPYLTLDPTDIGREYSAAVIRVNGQSGKGGVAYLLESAYGIHLPPEMLREFGPIAGKLIDGLKREVTAGELRAMFEVEYVREKPHKLEKFGSNHVEGKFHSNSTLIVSERKVVLTGEGNGPIAAFVNSLKAGVQILDYHEHSLGSGSSANAIAYVYLALPDGRKRWGAGVDTSIELAGVKAVVSAMNRALLLKS